ncbi:MAG: CRISPR-associated (Cas) DxTHG family protein [Euryarchaeota archaeon ADurb.Bin190]|nr:MAG: CRISPR-associated (Cas) DxTHG family protein [Euryarchaeota archaeon ADurb.Bin190]
MDGTHTLLTALGTSPNDAEYGMDDRVYSAKLSTIALFNLLPEAERFNRVVALCTEDALNDSFPVLRDSLPIQCVPKKIPIGVNDEELSEIVHTILHSIPGDSELTLDLTHGLRPIPFLFFTSCLYLQALKGVHIRNAWYGKLERGKVGPFVDLSVLFHMVEWFHAVHSFREMRNPKALVDKIKEVSMSRTEERDLNKNFSKIVGTITDFTILFGAGLPLELGRASASFQSKYSMMKEKFDVSAIPIPLAEDLIEEIASATQPFSLSSQRSTGDWKQKMILTSEEIYREARLIEMYFDGGFYNNAIGLMREFIITRSMLSAQQNNSWLNRDRRDIMEKKLGALMNYWIENQDALPEERRVLASFWNDLTQGCNDLHHHGMNCSNVSVTKRAKKLRVKWSSLKSHLEDNDFWNADFGGGSGCVLISPLGLSTGLLYSAICKVKPNVLLAVASTKSINFLQEIIELSGTQAEIISRIMEDPYQGFNEIPGMISASQATLLGADEIICNATGGTTAMQYAIMRLSERASSLGRQVKWMAIVDNRPAEDQRKNPYVVGEMIDLERSKWT